MSARAWLATLLLTANLAGCTSSGLPHSVIGTGPDRLRTFTWTAGHDGAPVLCNAGAAAHPVSGTLRGDVNDPQDPVWLEGQSATRLSVVWPAGFTVTFEPDAVLRDDRGLIVASDGEPVELGQVDAFGNAGTFGDPYIASGILFDGCYVFAS